MRISDWSSDVCSSDLPEAQLASLDPLARDRVLERFVLKRPQLDAIDRAGGQAQLAADAFARDDGVQVALRADDGVGRADGQAFRAADTALLVDSCDVIGHRERLLRSEEHTSELQ